MAKRWPWHESTLAGKIVQMARRFSHRVILLLCFVVVPKDFPLSWVRFKLDKEWERDQVFKQMGGLWRASKSRLVSDVKNAANEEERLQLQPDNIKSVHDWKDFVKEKTSQEFKKEKSANPSSITRVKVWTR